MAQKESKEKIIFVILPLVLLATTLILRATLFKAHWYFLANFSISFLIILFTLILYKQDKKKFQLYCILSFQVVIIFFNLVEVIDNPQQSTKEIQNQDSIVDAIRISLKDDLFSRGLLGIFNGMAGVFVFLLSARSKFKESEDTEKLASLTKDEFEKHQNEEKEKKDQLFHNFRAVVGLTIFLSFIMSAGSFIIKEPTIVGWTIRSAILLFGFIAASFTISLGFLFGYIKNALQVMLGMILSFVLSFFLGVIMLPFTQANSELVFIAQLMFYTNTLIFTGVLACIIIDNDKHIYNRIINQFLAKE